MLPLVVVLAVSLAKEAVEDHKRSQKDAQVRHSWSQQAVVRFMLMLRTAVNVPYQPLRTALSCRFGIADSKGTQQSLCLLSPSLPLEHDL